MKCEPPKQNRAVFAALDDQRLRAHLHDLGRGSLQVVFAREHARFAVVDEQKIPILDGLQQLVAKILDPVIHGVAARQAQAVHLLAHAALQGGLNVAEQQVGRFLDSFRAASD
jgi:hypothetical protein